VEGPSDELVIQKAYFDKYGMLPIEDGVDVINVRGLSFTRFLDIAKELALSVTVVTDNDGDYENKVELKYAQYVGNGSTIKVCADKQNSLKTLEPQFVEANELALLNKILGKTFKDKNSLVNYMLSNKTDWALKVFETKEAIKFPKYVQEAISKE
jgi:predicted ATP-dependent endonuclease of OLD family